MVNVMGDGSGIEWIGGKSTDVLLPDVHEMTERRVGYVKNQKRNTTRVYTPRAKVIKRSKRKKNTKEGRSAPTPAKGVPCVVWKVKAPGLAAMVETPAVLSACRPLEILQPCFNLGRLPRAARCRLVRALHAFLHRCTHAGRGVSMHACGCM
jgi:hypothetical protein